MSVYIDAMSSAARDQPLWMYGFGAGWGLYEYPGWTVSDSNYNEVDVSNSQTQLQTTTTDDTTDRLQVGLSQAHSVRLGQIACMYTPSQKNCAKLFFDRTLQNFHQL